MIHNEANARLPQPGEGWRHYKGTLYRIVGVGAHSETGEAMVIYGPYGWSFILPPQLWCRPLNIFLGFTETHERRFRFEREAEVEVDSAALGEGQK